MQLACGGEAGGRLHQRLKRHSQKAQCTQSMTDPGLFLDLLLLLVLGCELRALCLLGRYSTASYVTSPWSWIFFVGGGGNGVWSQDFTPAKQVLYGLSHFCSPFCSGYFRDGVSQTLCVDWPWSVILLISATQVEKIAHMSHWCPALGFFKL
jgi:hypothetical protein